MGYPLATDDSLIKDLPDPIRLRIAEKLDTNQKPNWKTLITKMPKNMYDERAILRFHMAILKPRGSPTLQLLADLGRKKKTVQQLVTWLEQLENFSELVYFLQRGEDAFKELAPKIERQPDSVSCHVGGSLALEIEASGIPPLKYQWYKGNYELRNQTTNVLRIDNVIMFDGSYYVCRVSNSYNFVYTNWCKVDVLEQDNIPSISSSFNFNAFNTPVITLHPRSSCVQQGADLHLYADAVGWPSPTLQWFHNDQALLGECCRELIIPKVTKENQGFYHIEAANKHTSINSVKAEITVMDKSMTNSILSSIQTDYNTVDSKSRSLQEENICFIRGPEGPDVDPSSTMLPPSTPTAKIGLIIGNQKYDHEEKLGPLVHPVNDAHDIAAELRSLDFKVVSLINLNLVDMRNAVKFFISLLDSGTYGLFYFAGHGFEIEGESYLMATDATSNYRPEENLSLSEILSPMTSRNPKLSVLLIDSCRTEPQLCCQNPISKSSNQNVLQRKNVTIGYGCCSRGRVLESPLMRNGYFAYHLMENIRRNVKIDDVLFHVAKGIHEDRIIDPATGRTQVVYRHSTVVNDLRLTDKVTATNQQSNEILSWQYAHIAPASLVTVLENDHVKVQLVFTPEFSNCLLIQSKIIEKVKCKSRKVLFFLPQCIGGAIVETISPEQEEKGIRLNDRIVRISNIERLDGDIDIHLEISYDVNGLQHRQLAYYCIKEKPLYAKISERMKMDNMK